MFFAKLPEPVEIKVRALCKKKKISQAKLLLALLLEKKIITEADLVKTKKVKVPTL